MFLVPMLIAGDFKGNFAPIPYAFPVSEKMENGPELYSRKKSE